MAKKEIFIGELPMETSFWLNNGQVVRSIFELPDALKSIDKDTFKHHVNKERNDFANWVRDIIGDDKLSKGLLKTRSQKASLRLVNNKVSKLKM